VLFLVVDHSGGCFGGAGFNCLGLSDPVSYPVDYVREVGARRSFPGDGLDYSSSISPPTRDDVNMDVRDLLSAARAIVYAYCGGFSFDCLRAQQGRGVAE